MIITTYSQLQDILEKEYDENTYYESYEIRNNYIEPDMIYTDGDKIIISDLGLMIIEGVYCNYNEDTDEYEPDFGLTLIYENIDEEDLNNFVYFEQDPPVTAIHNYLFMKNKEV